MKNVSLATLAVALSLVATGCGDSTPSKADSATGQVQQPNPAQAASPAAAPAATPAANRSSPAPADTAVVQSSRQTPFTAPQPRRVAPVQVALLQPSPISPGEPGVETDPTDNRLRAEIERLRRMTPAEHLAWAERGLAQVTDNSAGTLAQPAGTASAPRQEDRQ
jgi:hypothetical protein